MKTTNKAIKKILSIALCLALVTSYVPMVSLTASAEDTATSVPYSGTPASSFTKGAGTEASPYEIGTAEELYYFASLVNNGNTGIHAKLTANIVVNEKVLDSEGELNGTPAYTWTPIGNDSNQYIGTFDGAGHTISGLYFNNRATSYVGLFGYVASGGSVRNVGVIDSFFYGNSYVGGVVGENYGIVTVCYNTGTVTGTGYYVGGVVGDNYGIVTNCYNTGTVSGRMYVGGVVGYKARGGTVMNCYYFSGCATDGNKTTQNGIGAGSPGSTAEDVENSTTAKTAVQFASGEVAYLLNGGVTNGTQAWYQTIGTDATPNFTGETVYQVLNCKNETAYSNSSTAIVHEWERGICINCGAEPEFHVWNNGTCNICGKICDHGGDTPTYANGVCTTCGKACEHISYDSNGYCENACVDVYQSATLIDESNRTDFGFADDTYDGYYAVSNAGQLYWFAQQVNNDNENYGSANAVLTKDIVVNENMLASDGTLNYGDFRLWTPIGKSGFAYAGTFDGNNKTVSGLYFNDSSVSNVGLVGLTWDEGKVQNVGVVDSYFCGRNSVGGVVGFLDDYCTVSNCYNTGTVSGSSVDVGGVVGHNFGTVTNCYNTGTVSGSSSYVGGVVGWSFNGTVTGCYNTGAVSGNSDYVGGVVGFLDDYCTVSNCYNTGTVSGSTYVGGVVGMNDIYGTVENCYNTGTVTGTGYYVGGVVGDNYGIETNCYYLADSKGKTAAQFASGEVTYLLNGGVTNGTQVWYQTIGTDATPNFTGETVYQVLNCKNETAYSNSSTAIVHEWESGICTNCNATCTHEAYLNGFCKVCYSYQPCKGEGTETSPYLISNAGQLYWFARQVNSGNTSINGKLTDDIVVKKNVLKSDGSLNSRTWTPIGSYSNQYVGIFDGDNHTVSGLYFNDSSVSYVGLFGYVARGGAVRNVGVIDSFFYGNSYVGGVVGENYGTVTDCYNTGTVSGITNVGGVVGRRSFYGTVTGCYNTGAVSGSSSYVGGVVGLLDDYCTVSNCYNTGTVTGSVYVGGVVGKNGIYCTVENCYNTGTVSGSSSVGGVVGYKTSFSTVMNCYNTGTVSGSTSVGGVVGYNESSGTVTNCFYLTGCAKDGNGTTQNGIGASSLGSTTADTASVTTGKTETQFASGEVAWLLNGQSADGVWKQTLGENSDATPNFTGETVYYGYADCQSTTAIYTNSDTVSSTVVDHIYENGICTTCGAECDHDYTNGFCATCGGYQPCDGTGTDVDPYLIGNAGNLYWFAQQVNGGKTDIYGKLMNDITIPEGMAWTPIGNASAQYSGTFDGGNYTVKNLTVTADSSYAGLFGNVSGTVKNLTVYGYITVTANDVANIGVIGNLTGTAEGINSYVNISVNEGVTGTQYLGGVVGQLNGGTVKKSAYYGSITLGSASIDQTGGIVGYVYVNNTPTITNCGFYGAITTSNTANSVGGILGYSRNGNLTLTNCLSIGTLPESGANVTAFGTLNAKPKSISGLYYKEGSAPKGVANSGNYSYTPATGTVTAVSDDQLASGEVAYLLQSANTEQVWGQKSNQQGATPILDSTGLYKVAPVGETGNYSVANVGDTNADGTIDVTDYQALVNKVLADNHEQIGTASYDDIVKYDLDGDGYLDVIDATLMNLLINGHATVDVYAVGDYDLNGVAFEEADILAMAEAMGAPETLATYQKYICDLNADGKVSYDDLNTLTSMFPLYFVGEE